MNYNKVCEQFTNRIKDYHLSNDDIELFKEFLTRRQNLEQLLNKTNESPEQNLQNLLASWFKFMQESGRYPQKEVIDPTQTPQTYIFRATFGKKYTLSQLAHSPLRYSKGSNGSGLYATIEDNNGPNYLKQHLKNRYHAFKDEKVGNVLKIGLREDSVIMDKPALRLIQHRILKELHSADIEDHYKFILMKFISSDISVLSMFFGTDMLYLPTGHVIVLNKDTLMFPHYKKDFDKQTLRVDLERFRNNDKNEEQQIDEFLQK